MFELNMLGMGILW